MRTFIIKALISFDIETQGFESCQVSTR